MYNFIRSIGKSLKDYIDRGIMKTERSLKDYIDRKVTSWNDLEDRPFYETQEEKQIDLVPLQQVTFTDGIANLVGVKDPCYDLGIVNEREYLQATLEINGEVIDGQFYYYYVATGTFGNYYITLGGESIQLQDGASVKDGDTVEVRVYVNHVLKEVKTLDTEFLPKNVPVATSKSGYRHVMVVSDVDENGLPKSWKTINIEDLVIPFIHYVIEDKSLTVTVENSETIVFENVDITRRFAIKIETGSIIPDKAKIYLYCGDIYDVPSAYIVANEMSGRNLISCNRIYDNTYISEITTTEAIAKSIDRQSFVTDSTFNITKIVIQDTEGGKLFTGRYKLMYF